VIRDFPFEGMQVDILDVPTKKWLPGTVKRVEKLSKTAVSLDVSKDGYGDDFD